MHYLALFCRSWPPQSPCRQGGSCDGREVDQASSPGCAAEAPTPSCTSPASSRNVPGSAALPPSGRL